MSRRRFELTSFGVTLAVEVTSADLRLASAVEAFLPPSPARQAGRSGPVAMVELVAVDRRFRVTGADGRVQVFEREVDALHAVDRAIRAVVSVAAPEHVFIHAGVVRGPGGAIVIPGRSFSGKTTLVGALVRAGAAYLSDEYAVLDPAGAVWPYPRDLSFRAGAARVDVSAPTLGVVAAFEPAPISVIVVTAYRAGARWFPEEAATSDGALALLDNAVAARVRPEAVLASIAAAARPARVLRGDRGDAAAVAERLLALVAGPTTATETNNRTEAPTGATNDGGFP